MAGDEGNSLDEVHEAHAASGARALAAAAEAQAVVRALDDLTAGKSHLGPVIVSCTGTKT